MPALTPGSTAPSLDDAADATGVAPHSTRPGTSPAGLIASIDTHDFDEFNQFARGWASRQHVLGVASFRSTASLVATPSLQLGDVTHAMGYSSQGESPVGVISLVALVDDTRPMVHRGRDLGSMQLALTRRGDGFECLCRRGVRFVAASVARERAEQYAAEFWHRPDVWSYPTDRLRFADAASRERYLDTFGRILATVNAQPGLLQNARAAALLEEKFMESLFLNTCLAPSEAGHQRRYQLARRAYRFLQDHLDEVPSIREMCVAAGASYATLERAFRDTYGLPPKAMMTAMRLSGARRALLHPGPTTTVTGVALVWGFVEFGRFSVHYRRRYGEVPSETLRRVRGGALPVSPASVACGG